MEEKRSSRKRKHRDESDIDEFTSRKIDNLLSMIREMKKSEKSFMKKRRSSEKNNKNIETRDKIEIKCCCCCCCQRSNVKCCNEENRKNMIDETFVAALKNNDAMISEISTDENRLFSSIIDEWIRIAKQSLSFDELLLLFDKYKLNDDYLEELKAPQLNERFKNLVDEKTLKNDEMNATKQHIIAFFLSIIDKFLGIIVKKGKQSTKVSKLVETLNDIGRLSAKIHYDLSIERRKGIVAFFNKDDINDYSFVREELFSSIFVDGFLSKISPNEEDTRMRTAHTQTLPLTETCNSCGTQTEEIRARNDIGVGTSDTPANSYIAQNCAVAQNQTIAPTHKVTQNCPVTQNWTIASTHKVAQNSAVMQNWIIAPTHRGAQNSAVMQNRIIAPTHRVAQNCAVAQNRTIASTHSVEENSTIAQNYMLQQNWTVVQNREQMRPISQNAAMAKENAVAKNEEKRAPKDESVLSGIIDSKTEYPGGKELVRLALQIRGEMKKFPKVQESTWKRWEKYLIPWWTWCQATKTNFATPSPEDFAKFCEKVRSLGHSVNDYRPALRRVIDEELVRNTFLAEFHQVVKEEKKK